MRKAKYVLVAMFFGWMLAAAGLGRTSNAMPVDAAMPTTGSIAVPAGGVGALALEAPAVHPNACVANSCLGSRSCSACCSGHSCVTRTGCPQFGLACN